MKKTLTQKEIEYTIHPPIVNDNFYSKHHFLANNSYFITSLFTFLVFVITLLLSPYLNIIKINLYIFYLIMIVFALLTIISKKIYFKYEWWLLTYFAQPITAIYLAYAIRVYNKHLLLAIMLFIVGVLMTFYKNHEYQEKTSQYLVYGFSYSAFKYRTLKTLFNKQIDDVNKGLISK